jgi:cell division protein FtsI/penicillin-binding protein 2
MNQKPQKTNKFKQFDRSLVFKFGLFAIGFVLVAQLFAIQIIKHDYYQGEALAEHVKKFEVAAERGSIYVTDGYQRTPIVLNEKKYIVYADPKFVQDTADASAKLQAVVGGSQSDIQDLLNTDSRYVIIAKKLNKDSADRVKELGLKGVGLDEVPVRTYPQGELAAHVLGFVNDDGQGQYGVEAYLNNDLSGKSGQKSEVTDVNGTPLAINNDNSGINDPVPGEDIELTIDLRLQQIAENKLKEAVERTKSEKGSVVIIDPKNGQVKAMANYPTYNPADFSKVEDLRLFTSTAVSRAWEPGSVMKPITMSASFNEGKLSRNDSYYDPGFVKAGDTTITNAINYGAQTMTIDDVITKSLNTGAVYLYKSLGGGDYNETARNTWFEYLANHYMFNKLTGIELANEQPGFVKPPKDDGAGIDVTYANMAFGQGLTVTPIQLVAAYSALVNGGTYYKPTIVAAKSTDSKEFTANQSVVVEEDVISKKVSDDIKDLLYKSLKINNAKADRQGYRLGAKSGTAQVSDGEGNYKENAYNGAYIGYLEGKQLEYVVLTRLDEPKTSGFASFQAGILWADITNEIINNVAIEPR